MESSSSDASRIQIHREQILSRFRDKAPRPFTPEKYSPARESTTNASSLGDQITKLQTELKQVKAQNAYLRTQIAEFLAVDHALKCIVEMCTKLEEGGLSPWDVKFSKSILCQYIIEDRSITETQQECVQRITDLALPRINQEQRARIEGRLDDLFGRFPGLEGWLLEGAEHRREYQSVRAK
jgi:hypothetical protein